MKAQCPVCNKTFDIGNEHLGILVSCPHCNTPIQIPPLTAKIVEPYQYNPDVNTIAKGVYHGMILFCLLSIIISIVVFTLSVLIRCF